MLQHLQGYHALIVLGHCMIHLQTRIYVGQSQRTATISSTICVSLLPEAMYTDALVHAAVKTVVCIASCNEDTTPEL